MDLKLQKRLARTLLKSSEKRIKFDPARLQDISEAITKTDIRELIGEKAIWAQQKKGVSRARANQILKQKRKGLRKGWGSRKGTPLARKTKKERWTAKVRVQRGFIQNLKSKNILSGKSHRQLYKLIKGGFFRSKRHIKLFMEERGLFKGDDK